MSKPYRTNFWMELNVWFHFPAWLFHEASHILFLLPFLMCKRVIITGTNGRIIIHKSQGLRYGFTINMGVRKRQQMIYPFLVALAPAITYISAIITATIYCPYVLPYLIFAYRMFWLSKDDVTSLVHCMHNEQS